MEKMKKMMEVSAELSMAGGINKGNMFLTCEMAEVTNPDPGTGTEKVIGHIRRVIGGGLAISRLEGSETWYVGIEELWNAFTTMRDKISDSEMANKIKEINESDE